MDSVATSSHLPALDDPHERTGVGQDLQATLYDLVNLSLIGKQLHWVVVGPLFRPLHLHLDELVDSWRDLADAVAERAVALGFIPDGQVEAVAAGSQIASVAREPIEDHRVVWELVGRIAKVSELARARGPKPSHWQLTLTMAGTVAVVNGTVIGAFAGLLLQTLGVGSLVLTLVAGATVGAVAVVIQRGRHRRALDAASPDAIDQAAIFAPAPHKTETA